MKNLICFVVLMVLMAVPSIGLADHCGSGSCGVGRAAAKVASVPFRGARNRREKGNRGLLGLRRG